MISSNTTSPGSSQSRMRSASPQIHTESGTKGAKTYYWKASTSQFVVVKDGFILTLFVPSAGKAYYDKQLV